MKQKIIASVLLFVFFLSSAAPAAALTEEELLAELDELTTSLALIGSAISNSPALTEAESAALMAQLVNISSEILAIQAQFKPVPTTILEEYEEADNDRMTVADAELKYLTLEYNAVTEHATATLNFSTTTKRRMYTLVPPEDASYSSKIDLITKQVLDNLAVTYGIRRGDMAQLLKLTSRHPARDTEVITKNSGLAEDMATHFGIRSIVDRIEVRPSNRGGVIDFYSDQDELMRLSLYKNYDSEDANRFLGTYSYRIHYYFMDDPDWYTTDSEGNPIPPEPEYELFADDVLKDDITEVTESITDYIPFASSITNFDQKLVNFLTENQIYYQHRGGVRGDEAFLDCYYDSDKRALSEFLLYILEGIGANYEPNVVGTAQYRAPAGYEEYGMNSCQNEKRYF